ncbi:MULTISPECIES: SpoIIE family protein phosphatase [unclassified Streptomyces]|uniref:SpoIIE family protein phosphatase n=1 Tax=unclassified Streptomyces TaxID=2593676 RepID=UPI002271FF90|nr:MULTISPECIES: SpoIIE family protein phosphatase [unclassified Streptomyces]MCY0924370.1 SpoIIE family protein phosphatase [Streptomyces sp. H27-G5]MCY0963250.1 SpoIIE family protein phosphatase [Streptomyces sp. H27-H5]
MIRSGSTGPESPVTPSWAPVVFVLDDRGVLTSWSSGAQQMLGYQAQEVVGSSALELLAMPQDLATVSATLQRLRAQGGGRGRVALRARDGRVIPVEGDVCPLVGPGGQPGWLALADEAHLGSRRPGGIALKHEELAARSPVGMAILDAELRYVWLNDALVHGGGVSREESVGQRWGELQPGLGTEVARTHMQRVLETGQPMIDFEFHGQTRADPGQARTFSMSAYRLDAPPGERPGLAFLVLDATDRWQAKERLALLNEAGARIGTTLDVMCTAQELADVAVPRLADFVTVDLLEWVLHDAGQPSSAAAGGTLIRAGQQPARGCRQGSAVAVGEQPSYGPSSPAERCLIDGQAMVTNDCSPTPAQDLEAGSGAAMTLPLRARGAILGVATFLRQPSRAPFEEDDLLLAQELVSRAAVCLDNARRYTRERATATALQRSLLPHHSPESSTLAVTSRYLPIDAQHGVGGDWVDVIPLSGARTALVAGDVVGHGIQAAATMGRLRSGVHALAALDVPPDELLAHLDDLVIRLAEEVPAEMDGPAATCVYLVYDPANRQCIMARAGHFPPALVSPDGTVSFADLPAGPPLGLGGLPFESATFDLPDDTVIALYTDGLLEAHDRDLDAGAVQLEEALAHPQDTLDDLCQRVVDALRTGPQHDDIALLLARTHGLNAHQLASWDLSSDPALVAHARALATAQLDIWGLNELEPNTALVVSELVTNAIRYGTDPIRLRLIYHHTLICEVSDGSSTAPHLRHARTTDEGGRGLFLIAQLTDRWGTRHAAAGKTIWAELNLPALSTWGKRPPRMAVTRTHKDPKARS